MSEEQGYGRLGGFWVGHTANSRMATTCEGEASPPLVAVSSMQVFVAFNKSTELARLSRRVLDRSTRLFDPVQEMEGCK